jgi:hypothetical protein
MKNIYFNFFYLYFYIWETEKNAFEISFVSNKRNKAY